MSLMVLVIVFQVVDVMVELLKNPLFQHHRDFAHMAQVGPRVTIHYWI